MVVSKSKCKSFAKSFAKTFTKSFTNLVKDLETFTKLVKDLETFTNLTRIENPIQKFSQSKLSNGTLKNLSGAQEGTLPKYDVFSVISIKLVK